MMCAVIRLMRSRMRRTQRVVNKSNDSTMSLWGKWGHSTFLGRLTDSRGHPLLSQTQRCNRSDSL